LFTKNERAPWCRDPCRRTAKLLDAAMAWPK